MSSAHHEPPTPTPLTFPSNLHAFLEPFLPHPSPRTTTSTTTLVPHITLTYASSLDSRIALSPGTPTVLSGPLSKAMTHYLRSRHAAILIGVGTAIADDSGLNCRLEGYASLEHQPRPIVLDPHGRWELNAESRLIQTAKRGAGKGVWVLSAEDLPGARKAQVEGSGGRSIKIDLVVGRNGRKTFRWEDVLGVLGQEGIDSVMIEGGARVINGLLESDNGKLVSSVIVTIAPVLLGQGGVEVSPKRRTDEDGEVRPAVRLRDVVWQSLGEDAVMCGRLAEA